MKKLIQIVNGIGCVCLCYYAVPFLMHSSVIDYPEAMLPMERWDRAGMILTIGLLPLLVVNIVGFLYGTTGRKRFLFLVPCMVDLILVVCYWLCV